MGKVPLSEEKMVEQLGTVKRLLAEIEGQLLVSKILVDQPTRTEPEQTDSVSAVEDLADVLRETGEQIVARMDARSEQLDHLANLESRLRIVERFVSQGAPKERSIFQEMPNRESAFSEAARNIRLPTRPAPIDYTPVINAAIHAVRDIGRLILERYLGQPQKAQATDKRERSHGKEA